VSRESTEDVNEGATVRRVTVGFRYPEDRVALVDAIAKRRRVDRSEIFASAVDRLLEEEFGSAVVT